MDINYTIADTPFTGIVSVTETTSVGEFANLVHEESRLRNSHVLEVEYCGDVLLGESLICDAEVQQDSVVMCHTLYDGRLEDIDPKNPPLRVHNLDDKWRKVCDPVATFRKLCYTPVVSCPTMIEQYLRYSSRIPSSPTCSSTDCLIDLFNAFAPGSMMKTYLINNYIWRSKCTLEDFKRIVSHPCADNNNHTLHMTRDMDYDKLSYMCNNTSVHFDESLLSHFIAKNVFTKRNIEMFHMIAQRSEISHRNMKVACQCSPAYIPLILEYLQGKVCKITKFGRSTKAYHIALLIDNGLIIDDETITCRWFYGPDSKTFRMLLSHRLRRGRLSTPKVLSNLLQSWITKTDDLIQLCLDNGPMVQPGQEDEYHNLDISYSMMKKLGIPYKHAWCLTPEALKKITYEMVISHELDPREILDLMYRCPRSMRCPDVADGKKYLQGILNTMCDVDMKGTTKLHCDRAMKKLNHMYGTRES